MRSFESIPELLDEYEMTCPYSKCLRTFYSNNSKAVFCCDSHRGKHFREVNNERLKHERDWKKKFISNEECLKRSFHMDEKILSERELKLIGFDFSVMPAAQITQDMRLCYVFFEYGIAKHSYETKKYEIILMKN